MNIIFRFADLAVDDLSRLDEISGISLNAKDAIEKFKDAAINWQVNFIESYLNQQPLSYQEKLQILDKIKVDD
ncbi:hypothetical protein CS063_03745 [Sporanaerobium hydrogeniformans]|uniref:Uncharacterized protein n=1 Tax=Sporanaerobium hydrogeniformans TaxID=3072179 RepID=A0AC61DER3_9FIRM|nr:hypothetical protein [Sporanaerobium hydrogeniformans]PHV71686.1 hypothetical protein CS063_03745 [Sporanaerobium hydrogeniformans]